MDTIALIIDPEDNTARLFHHTGDEVRVLKGTYVPLRKWNRLIQTLDREYGNHKILGQDLKDFSYRTFQYDNGIWIHCEPFEFLIDYHNQNDIDQLQTLTRSAGYKIDRIEIDKKRIAIKVPY